VCVTSDINAKFYLIKGKTMRIMIMLLLFVNATSVHAEVYKCYTLKKVSYQPAPCSGVSDSQDIVKILKQSPQQIEEAQQRRGALLAEKMQQEQELQSQRDKAAEQEKLNAVQQKIDAAQREAREHEDRAKRDAESAKRSAEEDAKRVAETPVSNYQPRSVITNSVTKSYGRAN
jgi:hypothetical protein